MRGFIGVAVDGAFAEYIVVPARNLVRIPGGVPLREAGVVSDAVATTYHAARERARLAPDQRAAVIGAGGGLGVHMVEMVNAFGAMAIAVESDPKKLAHLEELGSADVVVDARNGSWPEEVAEAAGGRLDACFDFVCAEGTMSGGQRALGPGGTLILAGFRADALSLRPPPVILKEIAVTGTRYATRAEISRSLDLVRRGAVRTVIGASFPLASTEEAFEAIRNNEIFGRVLVDVARKN
jgi:D-arabinose 1-dehydrogenase-like Zn-dependent alcohol dehydrogenase